MSSSRPASVLVRAHLLGSAHDGGEPMILPRRMSSLKRLSRSQPRRPPGGGDNAKHRRAKLDPCIRCTDPILFETVGQPHHGRHGREAVSGTAVVRFGPITVLEVTCATPGSHMVPRPESPTSLRLLPLRSAGRVRVQGQTGQTIPQEKPETVP
jgi:hypothetical protein